MKMAELHYGRFLAVESCHRDADHSGRPLRQNVIRANWPRYAKPSCKSSRGFVKGRWLAASRSNKRWNCLPPPIFGTRSKTRHRDCDCRSANRAGRQTPRAAALPEACKTTPQESALPLRQGTNSFSTITGVDLRSEILLLGGFPPSRPIPLGNQDRHVCHPGASREAATPPGSNLSHEQMSTLTGGKRITKKLPVIRPNRAMKRAESPPNHSNRQKCALRRSSAINQSPARSRQLHRSYRSETPSSSLSMLKTKPDTTGGCCDYRVRERRQLTPERKKAADPSVFSPSTRFRFPLETGGAAIGRRSHTAGEECAQLRGIPPASTPAQARQRANLNAQAQRGDISMPRSDSRFHPRAPLPPLQRRRPPTRACCRATASRAADGD